MHTTFNTFNTLRRAEISHPGLFPGLSPGPRRCTPGGWSAVLVRVPGAGYGHGVPGVV